MMFELSVEEEFSGAHRLRDYRGKCERLHGHNWRVVAVVRGRTLGKDGLLVDFHDLRAALREALAEFDHALINDIPFFRKRNPSSEHIARYVFGRLRTALRGRRVAISRVTVWENTRQAAAYTEE